MTRGWFGREKPWDTGYPAIPGGQGLLYLATLPFSTTNHVFAPALLSFKLPHTPLTHTHTCMHGGFGGWGVRTSKTSTFKMRKVSCRRKLEVINGTGFKAMRQNRPIFLSLMSSWCFSPQNQYLLCTMEKTNPREPSIIAACTENTTQTTNRKMEEKKNSKYFCKRGDKYLASVGVGVSQGTQQCQIKSFLSASLPRVHSLYSQRVHCWSSVAANHDKCSKVLTLKSCSLKANNRVWQWHKRAKWQECRGECGQ